MLIAWIAEVNNEKYFGIKKQSREIQNNLR